MATLLNPGGFEVGGSRGLYADKFMPTVSDNLSKVWGTHTAKFGFFYEWIRNAQPANGNTNGQMTFSNGGSNQQRLRVCRRRAGPGEWVQRAELQPGERHYVQHGGVLRHGQLESVAQTDR